MYMAMTALKTQAHLLVKSFMIIVKKLQKLFTWSDIVASNDILD